MTNPTEQTYLASEVERLTTWLRAKKYQYRQDNSLMEVEPVALSMEAANLLEAQAALIGEMAGALAEAEAFLAYVGPEALAQVRAVLSKVTAR